MGVNRLNYGDLQTNFGTFTINLLMTQTSNQNQKSLMKCIP